MRSPSYADERCLFLLSMFKRLQAGVRWLQAADCYMYIL